MKKIMFNDRFSLTEAVIEKRKTVTRRELKMTRPRSLANCLKGMKYECMVDENDNQYEAPYYVGEIVAVAQSYKDAGYSEDKIFYRSVPEVGGYKKELAINQKGWENKMFVSANLIPHQIRILDVRVERLQDITDADCLAEGISVGREPVGAGRFFCYFDDNKNGSRTSYDYPIEAYASLIDKISGKGTWERNPYVWRIEFELIK